MFYALLWHSVSEFLDVDIGAAAKDFTLLIYFAGGGLIRSPSSAKTTRMPSVHLRNLSIGDCMHASGNFPYELLLPRVQYIQFGLHTNIV